MLQLYRLHTCVTAPRALGPKGLGLPTAARLVGCAGSGEPTGGDDGPSGGGTLEFEEGLS
jgi:hypothetical protein